MSKTEKDTKTSELKEPQPFIFDKLFKNKLRMSIFLLLRLYKELNVTQVSNYLNRSKATVGRHLKAMKKAMILQAQEKESNRTINPIYYSIPDFINKYFEYDKPVEKRGNIEEKLIQLKKSAKKTRKKFKNEYTVLQTILKLLEHSISLVNPYMEHLKHKLEEEELDIDYLSRYLLIDNHISLWHLPLSEDMLDEFYQIHYEFREKLEKLSQKGEDKDKSLLFIDSILPLKELLKLSGNTDLD